MRPLADKLLILSILFVGSIQAFAQSSDEGHGLVIRGKVKEIETVSTEKGSVKFKVALDVEFSNEGNKPIILFKPEHEFGYWLGGWSLSIEDGKAPRRTILTDGYWQSLSGSKEYRDLADRLDVKIPPTEFTKILQPKEIWKLDSELSLAFDATGPKYRCCVAWDEVQTFPSKAFQMRITFELSPWNVEYFRPGLIRKLQRRWKNYGNVLVQSKKEDRFNLFRYTSEPILIDLSKAAAVDRPTP